MQITRLVFRGRVRLNLTRGFPSFVSDCGLFRGRNLLLLGITTVLLSLSSVSSAAASSEENQSPPSAKRELDFVGLRYLEVSKRIALPTVYVKMMSWGRMTPLPHPSGGGSSAVKRDRLTRAPLEMTVSVDPKILRAIAQELYDDLVAQLRAAGWQVVTNRDLSNSTALFRLQQEEPDAALGVPVDTINPYKEKRRYLKVAPDGMPIVKLVDGPGIWSLHGVAEEQEANVVIATYIFDPVAFEAAAQTGGTSSLGERASLQLVYGGLEFLNPKRDGGVVRSRAPAQLWANIGSLIPSSENGSESEANRKKGLYVLKLDSEALQKCAVEGGKEFNRDAVEGMTKALKK